MNFHQKLTFLFKKMLLTLEGIAVARVGSGVFGGDGLSKSLRFAT